MHTENRKRLVKACDGALIVLSGYDAMQGSGDMAAPFTQEASFWWATGISEPGWRVIIEGVHGGRTTLVRPELSHVQEIFDGTTSDDVALQVSGAEKVVSSKEFEPLLRQLSRTHSIARTIAVKHPYEFTPNPASSNLVELLSRIFSSTQDCSQKINELRAIKSPEELHRMQAAINLTNDAFAEVRQRLETYKHEYELEADFIQLFRRKNATHAYEPIVASGVNACTLHYVGNHDKLSAKSMVLIDIGARVNGYCADVTRTYCVRPTKRQMAVHAAVVDAQRRCIDLLGPDVSIVDYFREVDEIMKDALQSLRLLDDRSDEAAYRKYFPHSISHGLGVDPHDPLGRPRSFRAGMVVTVEPGIYIPEEAIGVRIEDDILITRDGSRNLSGSLSTGL